MTEPESYAFLTAHLRRIFARDDLVATPGLTARDVPGWDSFRQVELLMDIQDALGCEFSTAEMDAMADVAALAAIVRRHAA